MVRLFIVGKLGMLIAGSNESVGRDESRAREILWIELRRSWRWRCATFGSFGTGEIGSVGVRNALWASHVEDGPGPAQRLERLIANRLSTPTNVQVSKGD
jgi:hypothetical protein